MANRLPLEQQTGADLVYFNEAYRSFILVQYKAMEKRHDEMEFRWQAQDQFCDEVERMESLLAELRKLPSGQQPDGFRFSDNPFSLADDCPRFRGCQPPDTKCLVLRGCKSSSPTPSERCGDQPCDQYRFFPFFPACCAQP